MFNEKVQKACLNYCCIYINYHISFTSYLLVKIQHSKITNITISINFLTSYFEYT